MSGIVLMHYAMENLTYLHKNHCNHSTCYFVNFIFAILNDLDSSIFLAHRETQECCNFCPRSHIEVEAYK